MERERMEFDIVIVGGGPAGLSAAIKLKQLAIDSNKELSVCIIEKGSEIGAHILSGAIIDPIAINELIPDWKKKGAPLETKVKKDSFFFLNKNNSIRIPNFLMPPLMSNNGNYIISLGNLCRWLASQAEEIGVEIYPGFAAADILYNEDDSVAGIVTGDMGIDKNGNQSASFQLGIELVSKYTLIAEGARGSIAKKIIKKFNLDERANEQKFGIGLKELWEIKPELFNRGEVVHTLGWPLSDDTGGGSFIYHLEDNQLAIGFVVHLNYKNPFLSPFDEFQRFKHHPKIRNLLQGGKRISYGARAITEGGFQSIPKLSFPGGMLTGCSAGLVNLPRIKGSHNAMKSGIIAAEIAFKAISEGRSHDELIEYDSEFRKSWIYKELKMVRNVKPLLTKLGTFFGMLVAGIDMWMNNLKIGLPITLNHGKSDANTLEKVKNSKPIKYPSPDGKISFDKLSSVFISNTNHQEDQPIHLKLLDPSIPISKNLPDWNEPAQLYCPAGVYEIIDDKNNEKKFQINAQNCVHCKTCDIKDPSKNIEWTVPSGGDGPNYPNM